MRFVGAFYFIVVVLGLSVGFAVADEVERKDESWTFSFTLENDLTADTDKNYTSGIKLNWISPDLTRFRDSNALPQWSLPLINALPLINEPGLQRNVGISLGQKLYTPDRIESRALIEEDRPYAGWLYMGAAFHNKNVRKLDTMELQLGVVGPAALGREAQNSVHRLRGLDEAKGWRHQLENEPGVLMLYERKWRTFQALNESGLGTDLIVHGGAAAGNVLTYANTGAEVRFGWNLPADFGTSLIRPGGDTNAPSDSSDPRFSTLQRFGIYGFAAATGRAVLRDVFLDGNSFADSHSVEKENLVGDLIVGAGVLAHQFKLSYAQVFRSKEFEEQSGGSSFGSMSLSYSF